MVVKTVIQRRLKSGQEKEFKQLLVELRGKAMKMNGFISGETLQAVDDPALHLTIGTWKNVTDWNKWNNSKERKAVQKKLSKVLVEPQKETAYYYL